MAKKFLLGISGASGVQLAGGLLAYLPKDFSVHIIISQGARECARYELGLDSPSLESSLMRAHSGARIWSDENLAAPPSSGSFGADLMAIIPTSMDTLAKIACGISDTLLTRSASVMIKERKTLLLAPREMPLNAIACEQLYKLSLLQVIIAPPIIAYYSYPQSLQEMESFLYGKWLDLLGIPNSLYKRWEGESSQAKKGTTRKVRESTRDWQQDSRDFVGSNDFVESIARESKKQEAKRESRGQDSQQAAKRESKRRGVKKRGVKKKEAKQDLQQDSRDFPL